ncbi:MAG: nucleotidyltransferase domain-containing protein [Deltaproteobacteria bacterium]|nr:nucleotidyltransferase domain-containing protein [Deltaproteobacteria bacterium]
MPAALQLDPRYLAMLRLIFDKYLKDQSVEVLAYGSRLTANFHSGSDLDLVIRNTKDRSLPVKHMFDLLEDIRESNVPILVDVLDWARIPDEFHTQIERQHLVIWPVG